MNETKQTNQPQKQREVSIVEYMNMDGIKANIQSTIGRKAPQFIASVGALVNSSPELAKCERKSVLAACLIAATLDLPINANLGFAYIIPYNTKVGKDSKNRPIYEMRAQFQMGYKGFIQLAQRSGQFKTINVTDVREGELLNNNRLTGDIDFGWIEEKRDTLPVIGYVAYMKLVNGFEKTLYMPIEEINTHGKRYSQSFRKGYGLWVDQFDQMARKTIVKLLLSKYAPMTIEMQALATALESDQALLGEGKPDYADNEPTDPSDIAAKKETERIIKHINNAKTLEELLECEDAVTDESQEVRELFDNKKVELTDQPFNGKDKKWRP